LARFDLDLRHDMKVSRVTVDGGGSQRRSGVNLTDCFRVWLYRPGRPASW
jgi:hypothetical protein